MKTPVIIAARNEEAYIGKTLATLDARSVEPLVMVNGSDDATARISKEFGTQVFELPEAGKLPALQEAVRSLGERALGPLIFLDADSRPLFPRRWAAALTHKLLDTSPAATAGMLSYGQGSPINNAAWSAKCVYNGLAAKVSQSPRFSGANMAVRLHDQPTLTRFLEMPHIWWGEDRAIGRMIALQNGNLAQVVDPRAMVVTSARYSVSLGERIMLGHEAAAQKIRQGYMQRAPAGSRPFRPNSKLGY
jgi:glycosyltransferase involved in cell wall biosynthesis